MTALRRARNGDTYRGKAWIGNIDRVVRPATTYGPRMEVVWKVYDYEGLYIGAYRNLTLAKNRLDLITPRR